MSERLDARAEVLKLARLLDVKPDELAYLSGLSSAELRELRDKATDRLFTSAPGLATAAAAAKLIPSGLVATIAQRAFGPMLCARAAGGADTAKAIDVAKRLPAGFLADVAVHLDPRRTAEIIAEVPEDVVVPVAEELGSRREHVTMGRFLAFVPDRAVAAAIGALDDEAMLRTAFVLEHKDRLDHAIGLLPPERLPGIIDTASRLELWPEALDLLAHVSDERLGPIADVVAGQDLAVLTGLVAAATDAGLWVDLVPLVDALPEAARSRVAESVTGLDDAALVAILRDAVHAPDTLPTLLDLVRLMPTDERPRVAAAIDTADRGLGETLLAALTDPADVARLVPLVPDDVMAAVRRAAERVGLTAELEAALANAG